jgi:hypothetical protein
LGEWSYYGGDSREMVKQLLRNIESGRSPIEPKGIAVMGNFTMGKGEDDAGPYISYYDRWNLEKISLEGDGGFFGKGFEIYDRLHYDPETFEPFPPLVRRGDGVEGRIGKAMERISRNESAVAEYRKGILRLSTQKEDPHIKQTILSYEAKIRDLEKEKALLEKEL